MAAPRPGTGQQGAFGRPPGTAMGRGGAGRLGPLAAMPMPGMPGGGSMPFGGMSMGGMGMPMAAPGTAMGGRPGTGMQAASLNIGARPASGLRRVGTAMNMYGGAPGAGGVGLQQNIQVVDRPVTQQGMMGMKTAKEGPGRMVQDKSYFLGELRTRMTEISTEMERLRAEEEKMNTDNAVLIQLQKRDETVKKEIAVLKNTLLDLNMAVDHANTKTALDDLRAECETLKQQNERGRKRVDAIFMERSTKEQKTKEVEDRIRQLQSEMNEKLEAEPAKRHEFYGLGEENARLTEEIQKQQRELEELRVRISKAETVLKLDPEKQRAITLEEQKRQLESRKAELERGPNAQQLQQASAASASAASAVPGDERGRLLAQVKAHNAEIEQAQKQIEASHDEVQKLRDQIQTLDADLSEYRGGKSEKYQELLTRDQEMQSFIDAFDQTKKEEMESFAKTEENIVALLEHISRGIVAGDNIPSAERFAEMRSDLEFKDRQLDFSQSTLERLKQEREVRKKELEKINTLDQKIASELKSLAEKSKQMKEDLVKYNSIDSLRGQADSIKQSLVGKKAALIKQRDTMRQHIHAISTKLEQIKTKLQSDDMHNTLDGLEKKIQVYEQNNFGLREYIASKGSEADYSQGKRDVLAMVGELNGLVQKAASGQLMIS